MKWLAPLLVLLLAGPDLSAEDAVEDVLRPFLRSHCVKCHGSMVQKADRRFDGLLVAEIGAPQGEVLQEILDQLNLAAMPPEDEPQPPPEDVRRVVGILTRVLNEARAAARENAGKVVLRRLNRAEYRNTVRDLFQLQMVDFDPTTTFPADESTDGFDNVGEGLVTSEHLLRNYLEAARKVADKAVRPGPRPETIHFRMGGDSGTKTREDVLNGVRIDKTGRREAGRLLIKFRQPLGLREVDRRGVPADGEYVIRLAAHAVRRKSRYKDEDLRYDSDEPMRLSISIDSKELGPVAHRVVAEYEVPDDEVVEIEHRIWLEKGFTFHVHWANGPDGSFKRILRKVLPKYTKDALYPIRNPPEMYVGSGPELHVDSIAIEGPFYDEWPPAGFARFFPNPPARPDAAYLDASLVRLATTAYRRPLHDGELAPYLALARAHLEEHGDFWAAAKYGVRAVLTSPSFLYMVETSPRESGRRLDQHELATRLSYFLWSSMPDPNLRAAADAGQLDDPGVLRAQVERLLRNPRASAFTENFVGQWLELRKLGEMPPDPEQNRAYYADDLESAMREETRRFFDHVLRENRSILEFVESDYTFLNAALARHYGISDVTDEEFRRVSLTPENRRGGLLTHGSILTATSNGVETQPVRRGVWILENLLGTPPNPPPPDIEPIEPDTRGVSTIRELMERHRDSPTCFECHRRIDPLGLSMENFDHLGGWRDRYGKASKIDASGELPDGTGVNGPDDIKAYLLARPDQFTKCLTEKLLVYALGRRLSFTDRDDVDRIVAATRKDGYGMRELVQQVVASEAFQTK